MNPEDLFSTPRVAAGVLLFDSQERLLLVEPSYKNYLDIPGGYVETGETPRAAARREVNEELGISLSLGRLLIVDWAPSDSEGDKLLFIFDGGTVEGGHVIRIDNRELSGFDFFSPDTIGDLTISRLSRRIIQAFDAKKAGETRYLEHGGRV